MFGFGISGFGSPTRRPETRFRATLGFKVFFTPCLVILQQEEAAQEMAGELMEASPCWDLV